MEREHKQSEATTAWHSIAASAALEELHASADGLSAAEAAERRERYGPNRLEVGRRRTLLQRFFAQLNNVLIYVLLAAAALTLAIEHYTDAAVIGAVVLINALIGLIQEGRAERAIEAIRGLLSPHARVRRDGGVVDLLAEELVPGDVVVLEPGDKVPADLRLLKVKELQIDESILTGESVPVHKCVEPVEEDSSVADRFSLAFSGTLVTNGNGSGVVVATADSTELGRINQMLRQVTRIATPLTRKMAHFSKWLSVVILVVAVLMVAYGTLVTGQPLREMFLAAIGLIVAAIPEGLPAIISIALAISVQRMAQQRAIIRELPAVETLGSVTVICSDKTGTLTRNEMTVQSILGPAGAVEVSGAGYEPGGEFSQDEAEVDPQELEWLRELVVAGALCNDASVNEADDGWQLTGDPTEGALVTLALKAGFDVDELRRQHRRLDDVPFSSERRFMATLNEVDGAARIYVKGAPERVLELCSEEAQDWQPAVEELAGRGQRVLALATRQAEDAAGLHERDIVSGFRLLGLVGMIDPPRPEAIEAVAACRQAGIRVVMITGDHVITAEAVAREIGLDVEAGAFEGRRLEGLDVEAAREPAGRHAVFARTAPEHKLLLVQALQASGEVVAMTGDGVNDAPALRRADVGVAMGQKGTDVAREAAEVVLTDDNFATIARAVEHGRGAYDNLLKAILFILPTNTGEAGTLLLAIGLGFQLPITALQILWVNMVTAVTLGLALAFEPPEQDVMRRKPRNPAAPILNFEMVMRTLFVGGILIAGTVGLFLWELSLHDDLAAARTVAVNTLVLFEVFYLLNCRHVVTPIWRAHGGPNRVVPLSIGIVLLLQLGFTYFGPMQALFESHPIGVDEWLRIVAVAVVVFIAVEIEKLIRHNLALKSGRAVRV